MSAPKLAAPVDDLRELERMLNRGMYDGVAFSLSCVNAFEPHGRASETWETVWIVRIPDIPYHWPRNDGVWEKGKAAGGMEFRARTWHEAALRALNFLRESGLKQTLGRSDASEPT